MNNTQRILAVAIATILTFGIAACSKDNDEKSEPTPTPVAQEIAGSYTVSLTMSVNGNSMGTSEAEIVIHADNANTATVTLPAIGGGQMTLLECAVDGVTVAKDGEIYRLEKEHFEKTLTKPDETQIVYSGTLSGNVRNGVLSIDYSITPGAMPMSIQFTTAQE